MARVVVTAAVSAGLTFASGGTFLGFAAGLNSALAAAGVSLALGGISYALTPKPKNNRSVATTSTRPGTVAIRQSDLTRIHIYGHTRAVRGFAHMESTDENRNLHLIMILCQGPLRAVNEIWVNDYCIPNDWLDADGNVTQGRYKDVLQIRKYTGTSTQNADSVAVANIPDWTSTDRLQGIAYLYCKLVKNQDAFPNGLPSITAVVEGPSLYDPRVGTLRWSTNIAQYARDFILAKYGYESSIEDIDDDNITAQMNICDEMVTVTSETFSVTAVDAATNIITLSGELLTLQFGDRVTFTSSGSLPAGLSADTDYFVIPYQIKDTPRLMLATTLVNSMAKIAIDITDAGSGTMTVVKNAEPRYHGGGSFDSEDNLSAILGDIASSMAGRVFPIGGAWHVVAGAWRSPDVSFTIDDFRSNGVEWRNGLSLSESFNLVRGRFSGAPTLFQETDYPNAVYSTFITQDLGVESPRSLDLRFTTRPTTAQRIAKIELFKGRQGIAVTCDLSTKAMLAQPGDTVELTIDRYGWEAKLFEITTFNFAIDAQGIVCRVGLRETAAEIYDWTSGEAIDYDPAPNSNLPDAFTVQVPSGVRFDSTFVETVGGDTLYSLVLSWDQHPNSFVLDGGAFEIQYKPSANTDWSPSFEVDGSITRSEVVTATTGEQYDLRIRAKNFVGARSAWVQLSNAVIGASGGVTVSENWGLVTDSVSVNNDWGLVTDSVSTSNDWGFIV